MPGGDRTGPQGYGPKTGRGLGYCTGNEVPGYSNRFYGRGFGRRWGILRPLMRRQRFRGGYGDPDSGIPPSAVSGVSEKTLIENEIRALRDQLSTLEKELSQLRNRKKEENE